MMETRFPISRDGNHVHIAFKWFDAFRPTRALEQSSIHYEKAAILFNLAAVMTQQALGYDRSTDSGLKDAARKFQVSSLLPSPSSCTRKHQFPRGLQRLSQFAIYSSKVSSKQ